MMSIVFLFVSVLLVFINIANSSSPIIINIYTKPNDSDSFYQDDRQNQFNIFNFVINNYGKDIDIKKLLKISDGNTVDPVLNVNNTNQVNTTTIQNKDKEVEKEVKVRDDYTLYPGHGYYKYHNDYEASWYEARDICVKGGAHLVVINSQAEADLLSGIIKKNNVSYVFAGFRRTSPYSEFITLLGGRVSDTGYNKWASGYPDSASGWKCGDIKHNGLLANGNCFSERPFICEK